MTDRPLHLALIWHMHQPLYKEPMTSVYRLPWVRLHGTKDYLDMVEVLREFPDIRQNFNLVPSLLEQLVDYTDDNARDQYLDLSRKRASELNDKEKVFMLENFFLANWENMIKPFPRYYELLVKRGTHLIKGDLIRTIKYFTTDDFLDLQVFFNLCWIDPLFRSNDPFLKGLCDKGQNYTEDEKEVLFSKQMGILKKIIPAYSEMAATGQIELSFTPFYHPILPLLCDTDIARVAMPGVRLPKKRFAHPEDARRQIEMGIKYFERVFNYRPSGMWPSEGSVSEEVLRIVSKEGLKWVATDEGVLAGSLGRRLRDNAGHLTDPSSLYSPHCYEDVSIVFRDHQLSDLIGFVYSQMDPRCAAEDLINRLLNIRNSLPSGRPHLVSIILDGENAWEHFKNDGRDFFLYLYEGLSKEERIKTTTVSDYLAAHGSGKRLGRLHPGSWINANYGIWIGHEEDNLAWDYLSDTREKLVEFDTENPGTDTQKAWKSLYAAEGSDWNWWYGDEHTTETQEDFDDLFRLNLMQVYREIGKDIPARLFVPVLRYDREVATPYMIRGFINPKIDGLVTSYYEWYQGAELDVSKSGGSMHKSESLLAKIHFGFNQETLFLRIDPKDTFADFGEGVEVSIMTSSPADIKITCPLDDKISRGMVYEKMAGQWTLKGELEEVALGDIFELAVPFSVLGAKEKDEIHLFVFLQKGGENIERCPWRGHISIVVPTADFEAIMWY